MPRTAQRKKKALTMRLVDGDQALISAVKDVTGLPTSGAVRAALRVSCVVDVDVALARAFIAAADEAGRTYNEAMHKVNSALRLLASRDRPSAADYAKFGSLLASASSLLDAAVADVGATVVPAADRLLSASPAYIPPSLPSADGERAPSHKRVNFRIDAEDAAFIDSLAAPLMARRSKVLRLMLGISLFGEPEVGSVYASFDDETIASLATARVRWRTNLSQWGAACEHIKDDVCRSRATPTAAAVDVAGRARDLSTKFMGAWLALDEAAGEVADWLNEARADYYRKQVKLKESYPEKAPSSPAGDGTDA